MEKLYTVEETALHLRVSTMTIYRWLEVGKLNGSKIEQKYLIAESEIKRVLEESKTQVE